MAGNIELDDFVAGIEEATDTEAADAEAVDDETSFSLQRQEEEQGGGDARIASLRLENLQSAIDDYYTKLAKLEGEPQLGRDSSNF